MYKVRLFNYLCLFIILATMHLAQNNIIKIELSNDFINHQLNSNNRFLSNKEISLESIQNYFTLNLDIGIPKQSFKLAIDTTSYYTWVPSVNCQNCSILFNNTYNETASDTSININKSADVYNKKGDVKGDLLYDKCDFSEFSIEKFGFISVDKFNEDFSDYPNGKLGLGRSSKKNATFSFLEILNNHSVIKKKQFGLSFDNDKTNLILGDVASELEKDFSTCNITTTEDLDDDYENAWVCEISHFIFGDKANFSDAYGISGYALFDSTSNYISLPKSYLKHFRINFFEGFLKCDESTIGEESKITCDTNILDEVPKDDISFVFEGFAYTVETDKLFRLTENNQLEFVIKFNKQNDNVWIFGNPFLQNYLTVFNDDDGKVAFSGGKRIDFTDEWNEWYYGSYKNLKANQVFYLIVGASILGSLLFIILLFIIVHSIKRRRLEEHGPLIRMEN